MRLAVIYPSVGRPNILAGALKFLQRQRRRPDVVVISAVSSADVPSDLPDLPIRVVLGKKGLPAQRNAGIAAVLAESNVADIVVFFDDDFAPADGYLETAEAIFAANPKLAGLNGLVVADGIGGPGYDFQDAERILSDFRPLPMAQAPSRSLYALYGCNMSIRLSLASGLTFDEALPLYAWQEDIDYTVQLARRGPLLQSHALGGVHLGVKQARTPGLPMGYSQIANPIFLRRKQTMPAKEAYRLMARNLLANLVRSIRPEPWCDRRGRLAGNFRALRDLATGTLHPGNILKLK